MNSLRNTSTACFFLWFTGNSLGFILMLIWFILLLYGLFLPSDPIKTDLVIEGFAIEDKTDLSPYKSISVHSFNDSGSSSMFRSESLNKAKTLVKEDGEDEISLPNPEAACPPLATVASLYYVMWLSFFVNMVVSFYIPLLAKYHLRLGLTFVQMYVYCLSTKTN